MIFFFLFLSYRLKKKKKKEIPSLHEEVLQQAGHQDGEAREHAHDERGEALVARDQAAALASLHGAQVPRRRRRLLPPQREQGRGAERPAQFLARVQAAPARAHAEAIVCVPLQVSHLEGAVLSLENLF